MKQISARAFRVAFPRLTEPVTVSTRGEGGEIRILGTWTPLTADSATYPSNDVSLGLPPPGFVRTFTPVPKPSQRKSR